jgi:hypothetical protein
MSWPPDVPDIGIKKPHTLEKLESTDRDILDAMDHVEVEERITDVAQSLAREYRKEKNADYQSCLDFVTFALRMTGSALGGKFGAYMVGERVRLAERGTRMVFPDNNLE